MISNKVWKWVACTGAVLSLLACTVPVQTPVAATEKLGWIPMDSMDRMPEANFNAERVAATSAMVVA